MHIVSWILLGLSIAVIANRWAGKRGVGLATDIVIGTAGASIVGFTFNTLADIDRTELNPFGLAASAFGAGLVLALFAAFQRPTPAPSPVVDRRRKPRSIRR
jgi:uncharacterized membrane protein YeaQ/YmgE (transglycosylase-associated protein family)